MRDLAKPMRDIGNEKNDGQYADGDYIRASRLSRHQILRGG
jgi:hypothetical protein